MRTCLAKDPEDRWQSARDIALELKFVTDSATPSPPAKRLAKWIWPLLAGVLLAGIIGLSALLFQRRQPSAALAQFEITAPDKSEFSGFGSAISPDGRYVALLRLQRERSACGCGPSTRGTLARWKIPTRHSFHSGRPTAVLSVFSPGTNLKRFDLNGVGPRTIATTTNGRGGTWSRDGTIVYSPKLSSQLWKVAASGGEPVPATILDMRVETPGTTSPNSFRMAGIFFSTRTVAIHKDLGPTLAHWITQRRSTIFPNCGAMISRQSTRLPEILRADISSMFESVRWWLSLLIPVRFYSKASPSRSYRVTLSTPRRLLVF